MLKNLFPNKIFSIKKSLINSLFFLTLLIIFLGLIYALVISPPDYIQGESVRIMYLHVPASFMSILFFGLMGVFSLLSIIFKIKYVSLISKSLAPIGLTFSIISVSTGSLWGKPTWGIWWVWDARLTSMLILVLFYLLYIFTWKFIKNFDQASKISSYVAIIGSFNIPIIKYSVDWWNTLHQSSSITLTSAPTIHYTMLVPLIIMLVGILIFSLFIFLIKYKTEIMKYKIDQKKNRDK